MNEIVLHVRLEPAGDGGPLVWWADSPQVPGFYVANEELHALRKDAETDLQRLVDEGDVEGPITVEYLLVPDGPSTAAGEDAPPADGTPSATAGPTIQQVVRQPALL